MLITQEEATALGKRLAEVLFPAQVFRLLAESEYATFASVSRRVNVVQPTVRYRDIEDLKHKLDETIVPEAEARLRAVRSN